jgi:tryptophan-rich sensory protein
VFFGLHSLAGALAILVLLLVLLALTIRAFRGVSRVAVWLLIPYGLWSLYACYLNTGFLLLNHL